ncbi:MAG: DUF1883 domain-containing protein [Rhizobiales bacterium]|nr:DUF1883 domain-containing protein [Hyphomicrobiales bacterium]
MNYLHYKFDLGPGEIIKVALDNGANVRLLDEVNFSKYTRGERHTYRGGLVRQSPARLAPPRPGRWHLVIDLGGYPGSVRASVSTYQGAT